MALSTLKLIIDKGPREGEALEYNFKPGFTIRVGRIVRGNTLTIKDNGISSKHLSIECCGQDKWVLKDLESSNGTILNSSPLPPLTGHDLRDGDVLKIGEVTFIRVQISNIADSKPVGRSLRRGPRVLETGDSEGVQMAPDEVNPRERGRSRGRRGGDVNLEEDKKEIELDDKSAAEGLDLEVNTEANVTEVGVRRGRSQAKGKNVLQKPEISDNVEGITQNGGPVSKRRTRNSKDEDKESKAEPPVSLRRTTRNRAVKNKDNSTFTSALEKIPEASQLLGSDDPVVLENVAPTGKRNTRATRGSKKKEVEAESDQRVTEEPTAAKDKDEEVEIAPDLSKMTLGEWLDHLERFLPKQIRAETDQVIQDMQKRSQQFHEFILQHQKDKGKLPLG